MSQDKYLHVTVVTSTSIHYYLLVFLLGNPTMLLVHFMPLVTLVSIVLLMLVSPMISPLLVMVLVKLMMLWLERSKVCTKRRMWRMTVWSIRAPEGHISKGRSLLVAAWCEVLLMSTRVVTRFYWCKCRVGWWSETLLGSRLIWTEVWLALNSLLKRAQNDFQVQWTLNVT